MPLHPPADQQNTDATRLARPDDVILVTGASGFIGPRVVERLLELGFWRVRCLVRPGSDTGRLESVAGRHSPAARVEVLRGNLLSADDCSAAARDAVVIFHLAAARGEKSFPDAFLNSAVTTRNLVEAAGREGSVRRIVSISSLAVYANRRHRRWRLLDESCQVERPAHRRGDAYSFAKIHQDAILVDSCKARGVPFVIVRPGYVYGPGQSAISGRVGVDTFGVFLHLGGSNPIPLTYVDNCADAIVLAGLTTGVDGEVFNVVDDDLPSSRTFLRLYKRHVRTFTSIYVPHVMWFLFCVLWERYSRWSRGQLPPTFTRSAWHAYWKRTHYSNHRARMLLSWTPRVGTPDALRLYLRHCRESLPHA